MIDHTQVSIRSDFYLKDIGAYASIFFVLIAKIYSINS
jgi:hypothetical protein